MKTTVFVPKMAERLMRDMRHLCLTASAEGRHDAAARLIGAQLELVKAMASWDERSPTSLPKRAPKRSMAR